MKKAIVSFAMILTLILPMSVFAVDFTIPTSKIDAFLQSNGDVEVTEQFTYNFSGEFNGMSRELIPKEKTAIDQFSATENGKTLQFEKVENQYKIFRVGQDEKVQIEITYKIINGVEKFEDGAQFYWPFFDRRNESAYENMTIAIHPPASTEKAHSMGYGVARETDTVQPGGTVVYEMGKVKSGKNGDIRTVFPTKLFPEVVERDGKVLDEVSNYYKDRANIKTSGVFITISSAVFLLILFSVAIYLPKVKRKKAKEEVKQSELHVPKEIVSIPAVVHFTEEKTRGSNEAAALFDLIRKGIVKHHSESRFKLIDEKNIEYSHEKELVKFLFREIGNGSEFELEDLETYIAKEENHKNYRVFKAKWGKGLERELRNQKVESRRMGIRLSIWIGSLVILAISLMYSSYELYTYFTINLILSIIVFFFALFYRPMTSAGYRLIEEWAHFRHVFRELKQEEWEALPFDDQLRAYTYGIGVGDKKIEQGAYFTSAINQAALTYEHLNKYPTMEELMLAFHHASAKVSENRDGGSSSSSGGGVGGGGGGSGAF